MVANDRERAPAGLPASACLSAILRVSVERARRFLAAPGKQPTPAAGDAMMRAVDAARKSKLMKKPGVPQNESARVRKLRELDILDTLPEADYDDIVRLAAYICQTPIALISMVDTDRQWFKARHGLDVSETPRDISFCAYAILGENVFIVPNATEDDRFAGNPLVEEEPEIRFYAGAPLISSEGFALGTLCVIDREASRIDPAQQAALEALARVTTSLLEMRRRHDRP